MVIIRKIQQSDVSEIYQILYYEWGTDVADRMIEEINLSFEVCSWKPQYYVAVDYKTIAGFGGFVASHILNGVYELNGIVINQAYRKEGIGRMLTEKRLEEIKKLGGTLVMLMTKEADFFIKFGFSILNIYDGWFLMANKLSEIKFG